MGTRRLVRIRTFSAFSSEDDETEYPSLSRNTKGTGYMYPGMSAPPPPSPLRVFGAGRKTFLASRTLASAKTERKRRERQREGKGTNALMESEKLVYLRRKHHNRVQGAVERWPQHLRHASVQLDEFVPGSPGAHDVLRRREIYRHATRQTRGFPNHHMGQRFAFFWSEGARTVTNLAL